MFHIYLGEAIPNITDWIQAIAGIAVFYTLYLQYTSNQNQQKQLQISLIPKFKITHREEPDFFDSDFLNIILNIKLERNLAYGVTFLVTDTGNTKINVNFLDKSLSDGDFFEITTEIANDEQPAYFYFDLNFDDSLGNHYKQSFNFFGNILTPSAPILIKKKKP